MGCNTDVLFHRHSARSLLALWHARRSRYGTQAKNIVNYLRIIHRILAPGGVWINLGMERMPRVSHVPSIYRSPPSHTGPLLWHFEENTTSDPSVELDLEEVKALAAEIGFEIKVRIRYPNIVCLVLGLT